MIKSKTNKGKPITLGILGAGQLSKMLALEAYRMGMNVSVIENSSNSPAGDMTKLDFCNGGWFNGDELAKFIESADIFTLENEFISPDILSVVAQSKEIYPTPETMRLVQDKFIQKQTFKKSSIPLPKFEEINSYEEAKNFAENYGLPFVLKTRTLGYDGYGNQTCRTIDEINYAITQFTADGLLKPLLAEQFIDFRKELAVMVVRSKTGEIALYPCVETIQENHICKVVIAPAEIEDSLKLKAQKIALACVEAINGVGVFGIEMFLTEKDDILVNEIAPRPHNSGHYTIEGCTTSQYENCIRAICGLPLGSTELVKKAAVMINLLGKHNGDGVPDDVSKLLSYPYVKLHLYNKKAARFGRKMGHITVIGDNQRDALKLAENAANSIIWVKEN